MGPKDQVLAILTDERLEPHLFLAGQLVLVLVAGLVLVGLGL